MPVPLASSVSPALVGESRKAEVSTVGETVSSSRPEVDEGKGEYV